jgi:hypothetical protein
MALINKLVLLCGTEPAITYDINLEDTDSVGINAVLNTIPSGLGDYTYSTELTPSGLFTSILTIDGATCTPYFYVGGVPYTASLNSGDVILRIGQGLTPFINVDKSLESQEFSIELCCENCNKPIFISELYEGDTYIPYYLDMVNGSIVILDGTTNQTSTFQQKGLIEASSPLVKGQVVRLLVDNCDTYSESYIVKSRPEDCDFIQQTPCYIKVLDIQVETVDLLFGKIKSLNVASYGDLKYRINNGDWYDSWTQLGKFPLSTGVNLQIKSKANPSCKIEFPMLVIQKLS